MKLISLILHIILFPLSVLICFIVKPRKNLIKTQLLQAGFKNSSNISSEFFLNLWKLIHELIYMFGASNKSLASRTEFVGFEENLKPYIDRKESVIALTAHLGNWEWMPAAGVFLGVESLVIVKRMKNPVIQILLTKFRKKFGIHLLWEEDSIKYLPKAFEEGKILAVVLDQYMGPPIGIRVNFFGRGAGTMKALALLAKRYKKDVVPIFCYRKSFMRMRVEFWKPIKYNEFTNIQLETQVYSNITEQAIKRAPEQWFWIHRRWKQNTEIVSYTKDEESILGKKVLQLIKD